MSAIGTKRQFARCKAMSGVGVKPTCRFNARTSQFEPKETSINFTASRTRRLFPASSGKT